MWLKIHRSRANAEVVDERVNSRRKQTEVDREAGEDEELKISEKLKKTLEIRPRAPSFGEDWALVVATLVKNKGAKQKDEARQGIWRSAWVKRGSG
jgi:hypothetical protein